MKTKEEEAQTFAKDVGDATGNIELANVAYDAVLYGVELAQRFIPVSEELPEENSDYLCIVNLPEVKESIVTIAYFMLDKNWIIYRTGQINEIINVKVVTHWRPIELK